MTSLGYILGLLAVLAIVLRENQASNVTAIDGLIRQVGETGTLGCVPTQSGSDIKWYRHGKEVVIDDRHSIERYTENSTLEIKYAGRDDIGAYVCREDDNKLAVVLLKSSPYVYYTRSINLNRGNTLELECRGFGIPEPVVTWYCADLQLIEDGKRIRFSNTTTMYNGLLTIENLELTDYNNYRCMALNDYGSYNSTTLVRVKSPMRVLWPIFGIIIQVASLAIIIFFYERRKKKQGLAKAE